MELYFVILLLIFKNPTSLAQSTTNWLLFSSLEEVYQFLALERCFKNYRVKNIAKGGNKLLKYFLNKDRDIVKDSLKVLEIQKRYQ